MNYFSEFGEDLFILQHLTARLPQSRPGVWVDIGCAHPARYSNTAWCRQLGWSGLAVDANEAYRPEWVGVRGTFLCAAVVGCAFAEHSVYFEQHRNALASRIKKPGQQTPDDAQLQTRNGYTLMQLCELAGIDRIDVLSLDIEGHEHAVITTAFLDRHQPTIIIAEYNTAGIGEDFRLRDFLLTQSYNAVHQTVSSIVYLRQESEIKQRLRAGLQPFAAIDEESRAAENSSFS
jgi:hypothetical protein